MCMKERERERRRRKGREGAGQGGGGEREESHRMKSRLGENMPRSPGWLLQT